MKKYYIYRFNPTDEIVFTSIEGEEAINDVNNLINCDDRYDLIGTACDTDGDMFIVKTIIAINRMLTELGAPVLLAKDSKTSNDLIMSYCYDIKLRNSKFIDSSIINMSNEFFRILEDVFKKFDLEFSYNNTRSCVFLECKS